MASQRRQFSWRLAPPVLLALALALFPALALGQAAPLDVYRSPQFGYLLWWDASEWTVEEESSESGLDWIEFSNDDTSAVIDVWGFQDPGLTADACLADRLDEIASYPDATRIQERGDPVTRSGIARQELLLGVDSGNGEVLIAARETCAVNARGSLVLVTSEWITLDAYNAIVDAGESDAYGSDALLSTIAIPRWAMEQAADGALQGVTPGAAAFARRTSPIFGPDGAETAVITIFSFSCVDPLPPFSALEREVAVIENTGSANLVVAPDQFVTAEQDGDNWQTAGSIVGPGFSRWVSPSVPADQPVTLQPGEMAIAQLQAASQDSTVDPLRAPVYFIDEQGASTYLFSQLGCQGGAASPIRIDVS